MGSGEIGDVLEFGGEGSAFILSLLREGGKGDTESKQVWCETALNGVIRAESESDMDGCCKKVVSMVSCMSVRRCR